MPIQFKPHLKNKADYSGGKSKNEVNANGKPLYKLSSNENALGCSPKALAAIQQYLPSIAEYPDRTDKRLRQKLAAFYGSGFTAAHFVTTNSGLANIQQIINAFAEEGTECIYSSPAFSAYKGLIAKAGAKGVDVPLIGNDFHLDVKGILKAINDKTRLIFVTSPNNPTGTHIPKSQVDELVANLPDHLILVYDEVYYQYVDVEDYTRGIPYVLSNKNVIGINSFSKAYGLAGLRIGYAYSTPEIATYLREFGRPFMINTLSLEAAIAALDDNEFITQTVDLIHQEKAFLYQHLDEVGVKYWKTQTNFIFIQSSIEEHIFEEKMLEAGIMVRPAGKFGAANCIRVTIGTRVANEVFIQTLKSIL